MKRAYADIAYDERKAHSYLESLPWGDRTIFGLCSEGSPPLVSSFTVELVKSIDCIQMHGLFTYFESNFAQFNNIKGPLKHNLNRLRPEGNRRGSKPLACCSELDSTLNYLAKMPFALFLCLAQF